MAAIRTYTLSNGLRVVWWRDPNYAVYFTLTTRGGTRFERFEEFGLSHILEHLCVQNPDLHREMELLGDGLANAETDLEDISYFFSFPNRNLLRGAELLGRIWTAPVSEDEFERERDVIGVEYVDETADSRFVLEDLFLTRGWRDHPLGSSDTLLWKQNLPNLTFDQFRSFRQRVQCGRNTVLSVVGDEVPMGNLLDTLDQTLGRLPAGELLKAAPRPLPDYSGFTTVKREVASEQISCLLGFPLPRLAASERLALAAFNTWFGDQELFSSVLFNRVRNDLGLVYSIFSEAASFSDSSALAVKWSCASADVELVLNVVLDEIRKVAQEGLPVAEFERLRDLFFLRREIALNYPVIMSESLAEDYIRFNRVVRPEDWAKEARRVQYSDLIRLVRTYLVPKRAVLALYGPVANLEPRILI